MSEAIDDVSDEIDSTSDEIDEKLLFNNVMLDDMLERDDSKLDKLESIDDAISTPERVLTKSHIDEVSDFIELISFNTGVKFTLPALRSNEII